ncbi:MAG TPA: alanine--tRNA ligase-related protein, partial [Candidatus Krumholzibacterium sp.]|nr:alanine--tRNA ligase-related protein [Candidatus Krumholzibacterium sp.]
MDINMIADHARALTFTIAEGIYPANEGRGYLLRRILRRALTRLHLFGVDRPFISGLVETVTALMKDGYPELEARRGDVSRIIRSEEESFFRTLEDGRGRFESIVAEIKSEGGEVIDGERAFVLYDTYGLPFELTVALAGREGLSVDGEGFEQAMEQQRRRAQKGSSFRAGEAEVVRMVQVSEGESSVFTGYEGLEGTGVIRGYRVTGDGGDGDDGTSGRSGGAWELVTDRTPFYATSGGQAADRGRITVSGTVLEVKDVFKRGGDTVHLVQPPAGVTAEGLLEAGHEARLEVDGEWRLATACNHTATHLLHTALRRVVGEHVRQAGSLVDGERLRFDFNHYQAVTTEERHEIERLVNGWVRELL